MPWHPTSDLDEFDAVAGAFLRARPIEHTLLLTTMDHVRTRGPRAYGDGEPAYGWWESADGAVGGAYLHTPPFPVLVGRVAEEAVESLVGILSRVGRVNAERGLAEALAAQWLHRTGLACETGRQSRLYRLDGLVPPTPAPPGQARLASPEDRALLIAWYQAFSTELGLGDESADAATVVDERIGYGGLALWEDRGAAVSMAGRSRAQAGTVRIGPVFTPVEVRGRGYAGALTADVSRHALDLGAEVVLFTDLANPTSNAIYQRLGYRPVEDRVVLSFQQSPSRS